MVKIQIYTMPWWKYRFTPRHVENSDLHHAVVKIQIYTMPWWKFRFSPCHGENSDLLDIFTMLWWKFRFTWHFHHTMVKIKIYMTFSPCHGENSDLHNIFTTHVGIFMTKFTPQVVKIDFHYKIYTTCGENSFIYTTCSENCHNNVVVTFYHDVVNWD